MKYNEFIKSRHTNNTLKGNKNMNTQLFNSFSGAYSIANTVATKAINKGSEIARVEVEMIVAVTQEIADIPLDVFGKSTMLMFTDKPCIEGKTMHHSMVIHSCIAVVEEVLKSKGLEPTVSLAMIASGIEVKRKGVAAKELKDIRDRIKGKSEAEMLEIAKNDKGGCAGGACRM